ncbi:MAG: NUDIX domain-containing protein [Actinobacteria bacterium]|nr:NUDIX domain-containing protein [Actinomycetota bacterium]MBI3686749.1 NUDIX domain-containing protein [Actinomycetota bacterium]
MIDVDEVAKVVESYLEQNASEHQRLAPLLASLTRRTAITDRSTFTGHLTCSAILIDPAWRVLHIRHNTLGRWLRPGGHVEASDVSLLDAALREVEEETGIAAGVPRPIHDLLPLDIDVHPIPANPAKDEPDHQHFDLRYAFTVPGTPAVRLQAEEVNAAEWLPVEQVEPSVVRDKLLLLR